MQQVKIGILGGSGFYNMDCIKNSRLTKMTTPFGEPSENVLVGEIGDTPVAFISRHGRGHRYNPSEVNYRANLFAMKMLKVEQVISVSAVGSLKEELKPTDLVIPDQYVDATFKRDKTFFEKGIAAHVPMDEPTCSRLARLAETAAKRLNLTVHTGGIYYNMEGPQFSTRAESHTYRKLGYDIIGMTQAVEAKLARELEICFLPLAFVTDYDCWHHEVEAVSVEIIIKNFAKNSQNAARLVEALVHEMTSDDLECPCSNSLKNNIITDAEVIPEATYQKLEPVIGKYLKKNG